LWLLVVVDQEHLVESYGTGGGGAGGFRTGSSFPVTSSPGAYTITVGAGGAAAFLQ
jgi:hypothetical protein